MRVHASGDCGAVRRLCILFFPRKLLGSPCQPSTFIFYYFYEYVLRHFFTRDERILCLEVNMEELLGNWWHMNRCFSEGRSGMRGCGTFIWLLQQNHRLEREMWSQIVQNTPRSLQKVMRLMLKNNLKINLQKNTLVFHNSVKFFQNLKKELNSVGTSPMDWFYKEK